MTEKNKERFKMLEQQKQQLEANLFKVMGAMELLEALDKEDAEEKKNLKKENKSVAKTKKVKH